MGEKMPFEFEQGKFGRFYIEYEGPFGHRRFTYLLGDNTFMGEGRLNGASPEKNNRVIVPETPDHRKVLENFRASMQILGRGELLKGLPCCDQPLVIYQRVPSVRLQSK